MPTTLTGEIASSPRFAHRDDEVHAMLVLAGDDGQRYALFYAGQAMRLTRRMFPGARVRITGSLREASAASGLAAEIHPMDTAFDDLLPSVPVDAERPMWTLYWGLEDIARALPDEQRDAHAQLDEMRHRIVSGFVGVDSLSAASLAQILGACAKALAPAEGRT
ncbi:MAG TPA: hypothetical protein VFT45_13175 [Longimicrobium sp.]|nr:hypothetical protein [Longimicrobium sp.]